MGVPLMRTKLWSYAVGAVAGGVGGAFYATIVGTVNVDTFTFAFSIIVLCAVILGGMGNVWGAILGAVVITWFNYTGLVYIGGKINNASRRHYFDIQLHQPPVRPVRAGAGADDAVPARGLHPCGPIETGQEGRAAGAGDQEEILDDIDSTPEVGDA